MKMILTTISKLKTGKMDEFITPLIHIDHYIFLDQSFPKFFLWIAEGLLFSHEILYYSLYQAEFY